MCEIIDVAQTKYAPDPWFDGVYIHFTAHTNDSKISYMGCNYKAQRFKDNTNRNQLTFHGAKQTSQELKVKVVLMRGGWMLVLWRFT